MTNQTFTEEFSIDGSKLVEQLKKIIEEGNVRKVIIRNETGDTLIEIPLTVGAVGVVLAPALAAAGAIAALVTKCSIVVIKNK